MTRNRDSLLRQSASEKRVLMPFIVTTKRPCPACVHGPAGGGEHRPESVSRVAVATLSDVHDRIVREHGAGDLTTIDLMLVNDGGGSVGPLSDGTTIEVKPIGAVDLFNAAGLIRGQRPHLSVAEVVSAYNAKQEGS